MNWIVVAKSLGSLFEHSGRWCTWDVSCIMISSFRLYCRRCAFESIHLSTYPNPASFTVYSQPHASLSCFFVQTTVSHDHPPGPRHSRPRCPFSTMVTKAERPGLKPVANRHFPPRALVPAASRQSSKLCCVGFQKEEERRGKKRVAFPERNVKKMVTEKELTINPPKRLHCMHVCVCNDHHPSRGVTRLKPNSPWHACVRTNNR
ncbi:hypothetical protein B0I35DRAFT_217815 [Stachybotrys elegans]|uniref:Uncharacterized protein n=1 Tax=Stachybotrys elegans TaxID=80388 RepID=A0A8K0STJ5_9HYPO|nr:hypothetical protein B0I35DRAFT_217815 [Stachybotrys elegans]